MIGYTAALGLGSLAGIFGWRLFIGSSSVRREQLAFATLGLLVGFLIGMSESPLVAGAVTGGFALAGALVAKTWDQSAAKTETRPVAGRSAIYQLFVLDNATSMAEFVTLARQTFGDSSDSAGEIGLGTERQNSSALKVDWLLAISAGTLIGVVLGAGIRINGLLNFHDESLPAKLRALKFSEPQIQAMMTRFATSAPLEQVVKTELPKGMSGIQAREIETQVKASPVAPEPSFDWAAFWSTMKGNEPRYIVDVLIGENNEGIVPNSFRAVLATCRKRKIDDAKIVADLKSLTDHHP
jgi:hypothetical protein